MSKNIIKWGKYENINGYFLEVHRDNILCSDLYYTTKKAVKEQIKQENKISLLNNDKKYKIIEVK